MTNKTTPLTLEKVKEIAKTYPTPFVIYDKKAIIENMKEFKEAFSWVDGFKNYFAVKACPNPTLLKILKEMGSGADCSSMGELVMSELVGITGKEIMFTSNNTKYDEFMKAHKIGAIINFDDITHIDYYKETVGFLPRISCCRYNPGPLKKGNTIIGKPEEAKYGMKREQLFEAYKKLRDHGVHHFGLHTMVASNELNPEYFIETAKILFELVVELEKELNITFDFVNLGGGIGIPYKPEQKKVDLNVVSKGIKKEYEKIIGTNREKPLRIVMECGRMITGPYGYLVTEVLHITDKYKQYVGVDASMQCLMRPALYGAYHHITVLGKENKKNTMTYDVTGSLCENNDKFAIDRELPKIDEGDIIVIHDAGAHGTAMGFNYNAKLRPAELLLEENGEVTLIRRAETLSELFATVNGINGFDYR
ncbi:MAG: diaminopimelate decarboxylase [Candidatus Gracilibacteria bacterium]|nr:diaminopimelate decarboxylase [Candidatus Gracilibacteria bacterium]